MKKLNKIIAALLMLTILLSIPAFAAEKGDTDGDGRITAADARLVLRASVGLEELKMEEEIRSEMNRDNKITAADARIILRLSVGLFTAEPCKEYDIIRSGNFSFTGRTPDPDGKISPMEAAYTKNSTYALSSLGGTNVGILVNSGNAYFISHEKKSYLKLNNAMLVPMGTSVEELIENSAFGMEGFKPLEEADAKTGRNINGYPCDVYIFEYSENIKQVAVYGDKLVQISTHTKSGITEDWMLFDKVSSSVPAYMKEVPGGYKRYLTLISFFIAIMPEGTL